MSYRLSIAAIAFLAGLGVTPAMADTSLGGTLSITAQPPVAPVPSPQTNAAPANPIDWMIGNNIEHEQSIQEGLRAGSLTPEEAAWLERGEARLNRLESHALSDNQLTDQEFAIIRRVQAEENMRIHTLSNNNATASVSADDPMVADLQRSINQQNRIDRGINNGSLTVGEVSQLENGQAQLNRDLARAVRDGTLTTDEQQALLNEARAQSAAIRAGRTNTDTANAAIAQMNVPDNSDGHHRFGHIDRSDRRDYDLFAFNQHMNEKAALNTPAQDAQTERNDQTGGPIVGGQQLPAGTAVPDNSLAITAEPPPVEAPVGVVDASGQASVKNVGLTSRIERNRTTVPDTNTINNNPGTVAPHAPAVVPHTSIVMPRAAGPAAMAAQR